MYFNYWKFLYIYINAGLTLIGFNVIYLKIRKFGEKHVAY